MSSRNFRDVYKNHSCAPRSKLYLADGYDLMRVYTDGMNIKEKRVDKRRGVLILYALPDTVKLGLSEAQTYDVIWNTFHKITADCPQPQWSITDKKTRRKKAGKIILMRSAFFTACSSV